MEEREVRDIHRGLKKGYRLKRIARGVARSKGAVANVKRLGHLHGVKIADDYNEVLTSDPMVPCLINMDSYCAHLKYWRE